jgi:VWFA-related protein
LPSGIRITANNVKLDCNGATLIGNNADDGIYLSNYDYVSIKNCNIQNYENGIYLSGTATYNNITKNTFSGNKFGVYLSGGSVTSNNIWSNEFYDNISYTYTNANNYCVDGIPNNYHGIKGPGCDCLIPLPNLNINTNTKFCTDAYALANGVSIYSNNIVLDCNDAALTGTNKQDYGVYNSNYDNVLIKNCNIQNYNYGIYLTGTVAYNNLTSNTLSGNNYGIYLNGNTVTDNLIWDNTIYDEIWYEYTSVNNYCLAGIPNNYLNGVQGPGCDCLAPKDNLIMNSNTKFCAESYTIPLGISIGANSITLDCNGAILQGNGADDGITLLNYDYVTVKNCSLQNYENGIYLTGTVTYSNITSNMLSNNKLDIFLSGSSVTSNAIWDNDIYANISYTYTNANSYCVAGVPNNYFNGVKGPSCDCLAPLPNLNVNTNTKFCEDSYTLADGVSIVSDNIQLDCNGAVLRGINKEDYGIYNSNYDNVVIKDCTIQDYNYGIYLSGTATYNNITLNTLSGNNFGIYLNGNAVTANNVWDNDIYDDIFYEYTASNNYCINGISNVYHNSVQGPGCDCLAAKDNLNINTNTKLCTDVYDIPSGMSIISNSITLDCNGAALRGLNKAGYGIYNSNFDNVTIKGCTIQDYNYGLYLTGSATYNNLTSNTMSGNNYGIFLNQNLVNYNNIWNNDIYDNIFYEYTGANNYCINGIPNRYYNVKGPLCGCLAAKDNLYINSNTTFCNDIYTLPNGINLYSNNLRIDCNGATLQGSNTSYGIEFNAYDNAVIERCTIRNYARGALLESGSNNNTLKDNTFLENDYGIYLSSADNNNITGNVLKGNSLYGIYLYSTANNLNQFWGNSIYDKINYQGDNTFCVQGIGNTFFNYNLINLTLQSGCVNYIKYNLDMHFTKGTYALPQGIIIDADNIKIDCGNSWIIGNAAGNGISIEDKNGISIKSCNVKNYSIGIFISSSDNNIITRNTLTENDNGLFLDDSSGNAINYNNLIANNYNLYNDQAYNVAALNNYWGLDSASSIAALIFDKNDDSSKGLVSFNPWLSVEVNPAIYIVNLRINQIEVDDFPAITAYITTSDQNNNAIQNLQKSNFLVQEDGQVISSFDLHQTGTYTPITTVLVMDYSGSMGTTDRAVAEQAAHAFVDKMTNFDSGAIIKFGSSVYVLQNFTSNKTKLHLAVNASYPGSTGSTALYDAVYKGVSLLVNQTGRYAIIDYTDGYNNAGTHTANDVINYSNIHNIPIYSIGIGGADVNALLAISNKTGGSFYNAPNATELSTIYDSILNKLRNQYMITFDSPNPSADGSTRTLAVDLNYQGLTGEDEKQYIAPKLHEKCSDLFNDLQITNYFFANTPSGVNFSVTVFNNGCYNASNFLARFTHTTPNQEIIETKDIQINKLNGKSSITVTANFFMSKRELVEVYVDALDTISESIETNNEVKMRYYNMYSIYIDGDVKPSKANDEILNYLKNNIQYGYFTTNRDKADIEVLIGRHNPLYMWHLWDRDVNNCGWSGSSIYCGDYIDKSPYSSIVSSFWVGNRRVVHIIANEVDGFVAGAKHFIQEQESYLTSSKAKLHNTSDEMGFKVFDYLHMGGNIDQYKKNINEFKKIVKKALSDMMVEEVHLNVTTPDGLSLRLFHIIPYYSEDLKSYEDPFGLPVVMSRGIHSNLYDWKDFGERLANDNARDTWLIEMVGGPTTDQECGINCPDYTFDDITTTYYPALIAGVQAYTGKNKLQYVGYSLGCSAALESLELWNNVGKTNAGYLPDGTPISLSPHPFDTFIGVGCPGNFTIQATLIKFLKYLEDNDNIIQKLKDEGLTHVTMNNIMVKIAQRIDEVTLIDDELFSFPSAKELFWHNANLYAWAVGGTRLSIEIYKEFIEWMDDPTKPKLGENVEIDNALFIQGKLDKVALVLPNPLGPGTDGIVANADIAEACSNIQSDNKWYVSFKDRYHVFIPIELPSDDNLKILIMKYLTDKSVPISPDYISRKKNNCTLI